MKFIQLEDGTMLNVNAVKAYKAEHRESIEEIFEPAGGAITRKTGQRVRREPVLKIETQDGKSHTLKGSVADAARKVLQSC